MYYTIYKTTNNINGKYYIGKHQTTDLNDGYLGSGKLIRRAIQKYGIDNFSKEILHVFDTEEEMNQKEKELVVVSEETYNLCEGGKGGFGYIRKHLPNGMLGKSQTETQKNAARLANVRNKHIYQSEWFKERLREGVKKSSSRGFTGRKHSEESKQKMRERKLKRI